MKLKDLSSFWRDKGNEKCGISRSLALSFCMLTFAGVYAQTGKVNVRLNNAPVKTLFSTIEKQTSYRFSYRDADIADKQNVTVSAENKELKDLLIQEFTKRNLTYKMSGNVIIVLPAQQETPPAGTGKKITGVVKDTNGEPIIGANVTVKGHSSIGTITDVDGRFTLDVPANAVLVVSYIGFASQEVEVGSREEFHVAMGEDTEMLNEVVVVGYGTQKKESLTGSMQVVKENKLLDITTSSAENLLSSKAPGVYVNSGSGQPGSTGKIVIRGKATVNGGTDPLWVIDGVLVGNSAGDLNPADVESISILKDAASTAIYGSMGANGVIVVTTKKGKTGETRVNLSVKTGISKLKTGGFSVMNGAELYDYYRSFENQESIQFPQYTEELRNKDFNWWDCATQTGLVQDYNVSLSGGTEKFKTYVSLGVYDENGAVKGFDLTRYNFRFNVDYQVNDWLKIKPSVWGARRDTKNRQHSVGAMYRNLPWDSPYDENNELIQEAQPTSWISPKMGNYLYDLQWNYSKATRYEFMGNFDFDIKLTDWLTFSSVNNYKYGITTSKNYSDPRSSTGMADNGLLEDSKSEYYRLYSNHLLRFSKVFGSHAVNALLAYEFNSYTANSNAQTAGGFPSGFIVADVATTPKAVSGNIQEWAVQSFFFNSNYAYDNKYLAQFSIRTDGASNFGANARYGTFFSLSAGWVMNREKFFKVDWINHLKLRASYGSVGARPSSLYPQYALYTIGGGYNSVPGAMMNQIGNDDLTWEKTYTLGFGLDATLLDRVNLTLDYYQKRTTDLLYNVPISGVTGWSVNYKNIGEVANQGFEATLGIDILKSKDWDWNVSANFALNRNEVKKLYGEEPEIIIENAQSGIVGVASKILKPGYDIDSWYTTEWAGVDPKNGDPLWYTTDEKGNRVKTNNYAEASLHPVICGSSNPDFYGGFSTSVRWKDLDLSANFAYSVGGKIYNYMRVEFDSDGAYTDRNQMKLKDGWSRWQKEGDIATHPKAVYGNKSSSNSTSSRYLEDAGYLRLRNLTIGYNIPVKKYVSKLRVYASGENLFVLSKFSGIDPEVPPLNNGQGTGVANAVYPQTCKVIFGLNVTL